MKGVNMNLSSDTVNVLKKTFQNINQNILVRTKQNTNYISTRKHILDNSRVNE